MNPDRHIGPATREPLGNRGADANRPTFHAAEATAEEQWLDLGGCCRSLSIQNTGCNTLWFSFDKQTWHYIMAGTSACGTKVAVEGFWYCTQLGRTAFTVSDVAD